MELLKKVKDMMNFALMHLLMIKSICIKAMTICVVD